MSSRETILVWGAVGRGGWSAETKVAIEQAVNLAQSSGSRLHIVTMLNNEFSEFSPAADNPLELYPDVRDLWNLTSQQLSEQGVKSSHSLMHVAQQSVSWPPGHPAPIQVAMMGVPASGEESGRTEIAQVQQTLETCRDDVWLATHGAFDREVPCVIVYDDLGPSGEQAVYEAVKTAQNLNSRLLVVHAISESEGDFKTDKIERDLTNRLAKTDFRTISHGTRLFVQHGESELVLFKAVKEFDASLIIMSWPDGPVAGSRLEEFLSSVSRERCSLLLIRSSETVNQMANS